MAQSAFELGIKWLYITSGGCIIASLFHCWKSDKRTVVISSEPALLWDHNWDKRDVSSLIKTYKDKSSPSKLKKIEEKKLKLVPTAKRHIFLIRHGQYQDWREEENAKLTALGLKQAMLAGQRLLDLKFDYTKLIRSSMIRAVETSEEIIKFFPSIPVESSDLLREGDPIPSEPPMGSWKEEYKYHQDGPRIEAAFRKYFHRAPAKQKNDSYEIIVCHANVIRYFICRLLQVPPEAWLRFSLNHCSITRATIEPNGNVRILGIGDSGFIPRDTLSKR